MLLPSFPSPQRPLSASATPQTSRTNLKPLSQTSSGPFRSGFLSPETLLSPSRRSGRRDWLPFRNREARKSELSAEIPRLGTHPDRRPSDFRAQRAQIATDSESPRLSTHRSGQRSQIATDCESPRYQRIVRIRNLPQNRSSAGRKQPDQGEVARAPALHHFRT